MAECRGMNTRCSFNNLPKRLIRRKSAVEEVGENETLLRRLNVFDLTFLGIGSTLGAGAYIIAGQVAKEKAGPAAILSFLIAAVCSALAALSYAEFGARVPKAGSVYSFSYVAVGEFAAFFIGWNILLEYIIGAASVARAATGYVDFLCDKRIFQFYKEHLALNLPGIADTADPLAFALIILITAIVAFGVKESTALNTTFTVVNITVLLFVIIAGAWHNDVSNWFISKDEVLNYCNRTNVSKCVATYGTGGFFPFGVSGVMSGAATAFFAFVGFDVIAVTGEEAKNPERNVPIATGLALLLIFVLYSIISLTVTMMSPYYNLNLKAPFAFIFEHVGWHWATKVVTVGAICALTTSLIGGVFPTPRILYTMARDGLLFKFLAYVHPKLGTALAATIFTGLLSGLLAFVFDIDALVNMLSIGTLMAYATVSFCTLLLRYEATHEDIVTRKKSSLASPPPLRPWYMCVLRPLPDIDPISQQISKVEIGCLFAELIVLSSIVSFLSPKLGNGNPWALFFLVVSAVLFLFTLVLLWLQPQSQKKLYFKVPLVPLFPALSILSCLYLAMQLDRLTWLRFLIWSLIGQFIYFSYGIHHSKEEHDIDNYSDLDEEST